MAFSTDSKPRQVSDVSELEVGDVLLRRKTSVMHVGVYIGNNQVFDNAPGRGESLVSFSTFAKQNPVFVIPGQLPADTIQENVRQRLQNPKRYHLFSQNCEHSVRRVLGSAGASVQLREVEEWAILGAALARGLGKRWMWAGAVIGAAAGTLSLPAMRWLKHKN